MEGGAQSSPGRPFVHLFAGDPGTWHLVALGEPGFCDRKSLPSGQQGGTVSGDSEPL